INALPPTAPTPPSRASNITAESVLGASLRVAHPYTLLPRENPEHTMAQPQQQPPQKIVLAYSGGLDTSVILPWLKERYPGVKLVAFAAELGQGDELSGIEAKARKSGADEVVVMDLRQEFAEKYCFPMLRAHAIYEQDYL